MTIFTPSFFFLGKTSLFPILIKKSLIYMTLSIFQCFILILWLISFFSFLSSILLKIIKFLERKYNFLYVCAVFNYRQGAHNVVAVTKEVYDKCSTPRRGSKVYRSGKDRVRLVKGQNYFMCNFPGHCGSGVKIAINAA